MKKVLVAVMMILCAGAVTLPVMADTECAGVPTSIIECSDDDGKGSGIMEILKMVLDIMTYGVGALAIIGMIVAGVQYLTARDNEAQMTKSKNRIFQIVIGLAIYAVAYVVLRWLLPGFVAP